MGVNLQSQHPPVRAAKQVRRYLTALRKGSKEIPGLRGASQKMRGRHHATRRGALPIPLSQLSLRLQSEPESTEDRPIKMKGQQQVRRSTRCHYDAFRPVAESMDVRDSWCPGHAADHLRHRASQRRQDQVPVRIAQARCSTSLQQSLPLLSTELRCQTPEFPTTQAGAPHHRLGEDAPHTNDRRCAATDSGRPSTPADE